MWVYLLRSSIIEERPLNFFLRYIILLLIDKSNRSQKDDIKQFRINDAEIIILGDELKIDGIQINMGCKITKLTIFIRTSTLSVVIDDETNKRKFRIGRLKSGYYDKYKELANVDLNVGQVNLHIPMKTLNSYVIRSLVKVNNDNIEQHIFMLCF
jgi:hypothetical protein